MKLSVIIHVKHLRMDDDDTIEESVMCSPINGGPLLEAVVRHRDPGDEQVRHVGHNRLGLDTRVLNPLILAMWRSAEQRQHFSPASELIWQVSDLRPLLARWLYRSDAALVERRMTAFAMNQVNGPDVVTVVVD